MSAVNPLIAEIRRGMGPWVERAACNPALARWFFRTDREEHAKAVCARCPVIEPCRAYALSHHPLAGVWGGLTERDRRMTAGRRRAPVCGKPSGLKAHWRAGEPPCATCREAAAKAKRRYRAKKAAR